MSQTEKNHSPLHLNILTHLIAGATAGAVAKTTIAPLDRTKINFQGSMMSLGGLIMQREQFVNVAEVTRSATREMPSRPGSKVTRRKYSTGAALRFIVDSYKNDGILSLWRGNSATMARIIPYAAIQFSSHEQWKNLLGVDSSNSSKRRFLAGSLAGVTSQTLTYPLDLARARMAVAPRETYKHLYEVFQSTFHSEGLEGLYRGYLPTILGVIPYAGVSFYVYGTLKRWLDVEKGSNPLINLCCGGIAGMLSQTSSYPFDIIRRRMQVTYLTGHENTTIRKTLQRTFKEEGIMGFYKGLSMNWVKGPIAVGISFATYEHVNEILENTLL